MKKLALIAVAMSYLLLTACGQTGPLYIPKPKSVKTTGQTHETTVQKDASTGQ